MHVLYPVSNTYKNNAIYTVQNILAASPLVSCRIMSVFYYVLFDTDLLGDKRTSP